MNDILARLGNGVLVMVVGMIIVFVCLIILVYLFKCMGFIVTRVQKKGKEPAEEADEQAVDYAPPAVADAAADAGEEGDIAAAIAAVMCMLDGERDGGLTVRPLRRVMPRAPKWKQII